MLVLSRRAQEKISFPQVGITIHFLRVRSGTTKVGIDAPLDIQIVRDEVDDDAALAAEATRKELVRLPRQERHAIRNELHAICVGVHLFKEQMQLGLDDDAQETFETIMMSLKTLDANDALKRPATQGFAVPMAKPEPRYVAEHQETNGRQRSHVETR